MKYQILMAIGLLACTSLKSATVFFPVDMHKSATTGFRDSVANDYMGGWFDEGTNDLRIFPIGKRQFAGVPFEIIDPVRNSEATCIVLRSTLRPYFPEAVRDIPANKADVDYIHFLHTSGWGDDKLLKEAIFHYDLVYEDGTVVPVPVRYGIDIGNWWKPEPLSNARLAWADYNPVGRLVGVWRMSVANPHPQKTLKSIALVSNNTNAVPGILAITLQKGKKLPVTSAKMIKLPVTKGSKELISIPADASAVRLQRDENFNRKQQQIQSLRLKADEYKIVNELMAAAVGEKKAPEKEIRNEQPQIAVLNIDCQPEIMHFFKHAVDVEATLRELNIKPERIGAEELSKGMVSPDRQKIILDFSGDPSPFTVSAQGDVFDGIKRYIAGGGGYLIMNAYPFGRMMTKRDNGRWDISKQYSPRFLFRTEQAFSTVPRKGNIYLKTNIAGLPAKIYLPAYPAVEYRILNEKTAKTAGWEIVPLLELCFEENGTAKTLGLSAALLRGNSGEFAKGVMGYLDPAVFKRLGYVWNDSYTTSRTGKDPRASDKSDSGKILLRDMLDKMHGGVPRKNEDPNKEKQKAEAALAFEQQRHERLVSELKKNTRTAAPKKLGIRDGMFLVDGSPKVLWGTEIGGYAGQGGNGVTSPLGKFYNREAAQFMNFDYAVLTLFPILREYNGKTNPRVAPGSGPDKRNWRGEIRAAVKEASGNGWALELNAVFMTYNEFLRKELFPPDSNYSFLACPEKEDTWKIMRKLYREAFEDILPQGNLNVVELDNESLYISYSEENIRNFRSWLEKRYGAIAALNSRWNKNYGSFAEIQPPRLREKDAVQNGLAPVVDWIKFQQETYTAAVARKRRMIEELLAPRKVLFSIQPFATLSGGEHRHSYAMRGCDYEAMPELADILSSERLFTPWQNGASPEEVSAMIGNAGYLFTEMMRCISNGKLPIVNTEGAMTKYGSKKTADEYRLAVWSHIIHGDQAVVPTYWCFFPAADSVCHPANNEPDVLKTMAEIGSSLQRCGELVAPVPRIRGTIAEYVSFESMRDIRRAFNLENEFYAGVFSRRPLDLITGKQILSGRLKNYRALLLTGAHLVDPAVYRAVREYVRNGGIVLAAPETFLGDEYGKRLPDEGFFPLAVSETLLDEPLSRIGRRAVAANWDGEHIVFHFLDSKANLRRGAALVKTETGEIALAVHSFGKGKVYQLGGIPQVSDGLRIWKKILDKENIHPDLQVNGTYADCFVEAQIVERPNGFILYLGNFFNRPQTVEIPASYKLASGTFRMTSLLDSRQIRTKAGKEIWLGNGNDVLSIRLPSHGTEVVYFEKTGR